MGNNSFKSKEVERCILAGRLPECQTVGRRWDEIVNETVMAATVKSLERNIKAVVALSDGAIASH